MIKQQPDETAIALYVQKQDINLRIMKKNFMLCNLSISLRYSLFKRYTILKMCWYFIDVLTACDIYYYDDNDFLLLWLLILLLLLLLLLL